MSSHTTRTTSSLAASSSGTSKSDATCATSTSTALRRKEQRPNLSKRLKECWEDISEFETEYAKFDTVLNERDTALGKLRTIRGKLERRERDINLLKDSRKLDLDDFLAKTESLRNEKSQMAEKYSSEKQSAKRELSSNQAMITSLNADLELAHDEARLTKAQLEAANQELGQWRAPLSRLRLLDAQDLGAKIEGLFDTCAEVARNLFFGDLPPEILNRHDDWDQGVRKLNISLGPPPSNSHPAKIMRLAVAMNVIANELVETIFRPCLIPDSKEQSATVQEILEKHFRGDQRTRSFMHAQLLSTHTRDDRRTVLQDWAMTASANVSGKLSFMALNSGPNLVSQMRDCFQSAADFWCELQEIDDHIKIITPETYCIPEWGWEALADFGDTTQSTEAALMLFPGFDVPDRKVELFRGFALWKDQEHAAKADVEWKTFQKRSVSGRRRGSGSKSSAMRRFSVSITGFPTPPTSPKSSGKEQNPQA